MISSEHQWLAERLDRIDDDNKEIIKELKSVSSTVAKHGVYWDIVKWIGVSGAGVAASAAAFLGFNKH